MKRIKLLIALTIVSALVLMGCDEEESAPAEQTAEAVEEVEEEAAVEEVEEIDEAAIEDIPSDDELEEEIAGFEDIEYSYVCSLYLVGGETPTDNFEEVTFENYDDGSYLYEYMTGDGLLFFTNEGPIWYENVDDMTLEDHIYDAVLSLAGTDIEDVEIEGAGEYGEGNSYPTYIASFTTGSNEDTRSWRVYATDTDWGIFLYSVSGPADYEEDVIAAADDIFPALYIADRNEGEDEVYSD